MCNIFPRPIPFRNSCAATAPDEGRASGLKREHHILQGSRDMWMTTLAGSWSKRIAIALLASDADRPSGSICCKLLEKTICEARSGARLLRAL